MGDDKLTVKAPAVIKLLGEHAVVYGKLSIAAAVSLYAQASTRALKGSRLVIALSDLKESAKFSRRELGALYDAYKAKESPEAYIQRSGSIAKDALPYATIAARLQSEFGLEVTGRKVTIKSKIPKQSGLASSASCYTAFTVALTRALGARLSDDQMVDVARDGERVAHANEGAGRIDVNTSYYGGYVSYSESQGVKQETYELQPKFLLINTGPKRSTLETVGHIAALYKEDREETERMLNRIEECSRRGLEALGAKKLKELGKLMLEDQMLLKQLGVSSDGLDKAVEVAVANGAYGAKLSGGGGGGIAIALIKGNSGKIKTALEEQGFAVFKARISNDGARQYLQPTS